MKGIGAKIEDGVEERLESLCRDGKSEFCTDTSSVSIEASTNCGIFSLFEIVLMIAVTVGAGIVLCACITAACRYLYLTSRGEVLDDQMPFFLMRGDGGDRRAEARQRLEQLRVFKYGEEGHEPRLNNGEEEICPITLIALEVGTEVAVFPGCGHRFIADSLRQWLQTRDTCPVCRMRWSREAASSSTYKESFGRRETDLRAGVAVPGDGDHAANAALSVAADGGVWSGGRSGGEGRGDGSRTTTRLGSSPPRDSHSELPLEHGGEQLARSRASDPLFLAHESSHRRLSRNSSWGRDNDPADTSPRSRSWHNGVLAPVLRSSHGQEEPQRNELLAGTEETANEPLLTFGAQQGPRNAGGQS